MVIGCCRSTGTVQLVTDRQRGSGGCVAAEKRKWCSGMYRYFTVGVGTVALENWRRDRRNGWWRAAAGAGAGAAAVVIWGRRSASCIACCPPAL